MYEWPIDRANAAGRRFFGTDDVGNIAIHHRIDVIAINLLPPPVIEVPDSGKPPAQDEIDIIRPRRGFRRRQIIQVRRFGDRPIKYLRRAARHRFGHGHRPQRQRQHAAGQRVGHMQRRENVGGTREDKPSFGCRDRTILLIASDSFPERCASSITSGPIFQFADEPLQLSPRVVFDCFQQRIIVERDESSILENVPNERRSCPPDAPPRC